jgi:hypothetical protein
MNRRQILGGMGLLGVGAVTRGLGAGTAGAVQETSTALESAKAVVLTPACFMTRRRRKVPTTSTPT